MEVPKDCQNPYDTQCTGSKERYDSGHKGVAEAANGAHKGIHHTAGEVENADIF